MASQPTWQRNIVKEGRMRLTIHSPSINSKPLSQRIRRLLNLSSPSKFLHYNTNDPSPRSSTHLNPHHEIPSNNNPPPQPPRSKHHFRRKPLPSFSQPSLKKNRLPSRQPLSPPAMQNLSIIRVIVRSLTVDTDPKNALHKLPMRHGNVL